MSIYLPTRFRNYLTPNGDTQWKDVLDTWRDSEQDDFHQMHIERGGHSDWDNWRDGMIGLLNLNELAWREYTIDSAFDVIPNLRSGPFASWIDRYYRGEIMPLFSELFFKPGTDTEKREEFVAKSQEETQHLIGLIHNDDIVIIDGIHRCNALIQEFRSGNNISPKIKISLAQSSAQVLPIIGIPVEAGVEI